MGNMHVNRLSPSLEPFENCPEQTSIVEFWNVIRVCEELGETTWEELEPLERRTTECLHQVPPDIVGARNATAEALNLLQR